MKDTAADVVSDDPGARAGQVGLALAAVATGLLVYALLAIVASGPVVGPGATLAVGAAAGMLWLVGIRAATATDRASEALVVTATASVLVAMAASTLHHLAGYLTLPVDLLSFAEGPFLTDLVKLRLGAPLYTDPLDNNSYLYTPGTQILTYAIASLLGHGDSVAALRLVAFSYVVLAALAATMACRLLARTLTRPSWRVPGPVWSVAWFSGLLLVATDPRFNLFNHSLHNDGLALLVSMVAFWLMVRSAVAPRTWLVVAMGVLPAVGFLVKQSLLVWAGVFALVLLVDGRVSWRQRALFVLVGVLAAGGVVTACTLLWGAEFHFWVFNALGVKRVSLARSVLNLLEAGMYGALGLAAGTVLLLRSTPRPVVAAWLGWVVLFGVETYTSGIGFTANHLGPGVVLATAWWLVAVFAVWPSVESVRSRWRRLALQGMAAGVMLGVVAGLGVVREPRNPVSPDFFRYVDAIEAEFRGLPVDSVLMDDGTWIYLRHNVLMKDRGSPVAVHVGINQPAINHRMLVATIARIEAKQYRKILVRGLDNGTSLYDFQNRGSGVVTAILDHYRVVRRIPGVQDVREWWPRLLVSEVLVLVPKDREGGDGTRSGG